MNIKIFFQILFFFLAIDIPAQKYLTNGQVYNYNIGDVFEEEDYANPLSGPPHYSLFIVLGKAYSIASDTIYYKDSDVGYVPPSCMTCKGSFGAGIYNFYITNLTLPALQANMGNTCPLKDTVYYDSTDYCGRKVWERYPDHTCLDSGFEDVTTFSWVVEGCGGAYLNYFDPACPCGDISQLIYYKKVPDDSCGGEYVITGINQPASKNVQLSLYPNPSSSFLNISTPANIYWYDMVDISGRIVISTSFPKNNQINLKGLSPGYYMIDFYTRDYGRIAKQFEKE